MEQALEAKIPSLKSKLELLSCSSIEITLRKNYGRLFGIPGNSGSHVIFVRLTDRINGNKATFYIYFLDTGGSYKATIENQYSYLYEDFYKRNYALEQLIQVKLNEWCSNDVACEM